VYFMSARALSAQGFSAAILSLGTLALLATVTNWNSPDEIRFAVILLLANIASGWKRGSRALPGTVAVGTLFILVGLVAFTLPETVLIGASAVLTQTLLHERVSWKDVVFRMCNTAIAITCAHYVYQAAWQGAGTSPLWPLIPATLLFALFNTFAAAVQHSRAKNIAVVEVWHERGFWTLPSQFLGAGMAALFGWLSSGVGWPYAFATLPVFYYCYQWADAYMENLRSRRWVGGEMANHHHRTLETLALAIAARFRSANDQLSRTQSYSMTIAEAMRLPMPDREALRIASVMHDVGTLAIPEQIMGKAGKLTAEEFERVKIHPVVGAEIVERAEFPYPVATVVRHHHERWDGNGYPDGLRGKAIPLPARILAVVDCLVSLTADRPQRRAMSFERAFSFVRSQSGMAFDPEVIDVLAKCADQFQALLPSPSRPDGESADFVASISSAHQESRETYALAQQLGMSLQLSETLETLDQRIPSMLPYDAMAVYLLRDGALLPEYASGLAKSAVFAARITSATGTSGAAARTGETILNGDPRQDLGPCEGLDLESALATPLVGADGTIGVLTLYRKGRRAFTGRDREVITGVRTILASAVEKALRFEKAEASATTDHLTGLPNARSLFQRAETEIARCRRNRGTFAVIVSDLDGFKNVNDTAGHLAGNNVLKEVAATLQGYCREYDYVARLGGDEFVVLLPGLPDEALNVKLGHLSRVVSEAAERIAPGCGVTLSTGCAKYPDDGTDAESLLARADSRMYAAKRRGKPGHPGFLFDITPSGTVM
jgi:diguanylate cyclase (GGDEF)-like protein